MPVRPLSHKSNKLAPGRPRGATTFDPTIAAAFGSAIRDARTSADVSQEALALASGVERSYLGRIERGQSMPTLFVVLKLARALKISSGDIVEQVDLATATPSRKRMLRSLLA